MKISWPFARAEQPAAAPEPVRQEPVIAAPQNNQQLPLSSGVHGSELYGWITNGLGTGVAVTEQTAMCVSAVYACVGLIGGALASMPLPIYQRDAENDRKRVDHKLWWLFNEQPWAALSAAVFWEYLAWSLMLHGDAMARIHRASPLSPDIKGFEPLHPLQVVVHKNGDRLAYTIYRENGKTETIDQDDMLHVPGVGFNGLRGMSLLRYALRAPAGIALAADEYSSAYFRNGAKTDVALVAPGSLKPDDVKLMHENWKQTQGAINNSFMPAILSGGVKIEHLALSAEDAQLIETRRLQVEEIARIYGVPPFMIGHTEKTTSWGSGVEQMGIGFVKYTLQRHLVKFEQEINRKCFRTAKFFAEFNTAGLERGDLKSRNEAYRIALGRAGEPGWMKVNEVRKAENMPPVEGGDVLSMATATSAGTKE